MKLWKFENGVHNLVYINLGIATCCFLISNALHTVHGFGNAAYGLKHYWSPVINFASYLAYVLLSYFLHEAAFTNNGKCCLKWTVIKTSLVITWFWMMIKYLDNLDPITGYKPQESMADIYLVKYFLLFFCLAADFYQTIVTGCFIVYVKRIKKIRRQELINSENWGDEEMMELN